MKVTYRQKFTPSNLPVPALSILIIAFSTSLIRGENALESENLLN
jgi:hypothetical protein